MSYTLKKHLSKKSNYGAKRSTSAIKYIVIHYTANDGDSDESNARYFANNSVKSSAHYFVDDDSITQSVPDHYVAWQSEAQNTVTPILPAAENIIQSARIVTALASNCATRKEMVNIIPLLQQSKMHWHSPGN